MIIYNKQDTYRQFSTTPTAYKKNNVLFLVVYKRRYIKVHHVVHVSFYRSTTTCMLCQCVAAVSFFCFQFSHFFFPLSFSFSFSLSFSFFLSFFSLSLSIQSTHCICPLGQCIPLRTHSTTNSRVHHKYTLSLINL